MAGEVRKRGPYHARSGECACRGGDVDILFVRVLRGGKVVVSVWYHVAFVARVVGTAC